MLSGDGLTEAVVQHAGSKIVAAQCQIEIDPCSDLLSTLLPCLLACLDDPLGLLESRAEPTLKFYAFWLIIDIRVTLVSSYLTKKPGGHSLNLPPEIPNDHIMASSNSLVRS